MLRLLIVGCPHSGTRFIAQMLTRAGLPCGHEQVFALDGVKPATRIAESSWVATHYLGLNAIPSETVVVHQTRDPIAWLNSWVRTTTADAAWRFLEIMYPGIGAERARDPVRTAMRLWVRMNRRCESSSLRTFRIEAVDHEFGSGITHQLGELAGVTLGPDRIADALAATDLDRNHHPGESGHVPLAWGSLPAGPDRDEFAGLARAYGYDGL